MPIYKKVNVDFFKKWDADMAYILGFFAADGNMVPTKRGTHFVSFTSMDESILLNIRTVMQSEHKLSKRVSQTGRVYRFQMGSKAMYDDLYKLGFTGNKSKRMIMPDIPKQFQSDFIRGYFDGDGNVWVGMLNKNRKTPTNAIQVAFTSGSKVFLEGLLSLLNNKGIKGGSIYSSKTKNFSRLQLSTSDALKLYEIMYNGQPKLYLQRKKLRFDQFRLKRSANNRIK